MPKVAAAPNIERTGVIAGFVLGLGAGLTPAITVGVLFAQETMYRPASAPTLPAAGASQQSWLFYNSTSGFYWASSFTPATAGDAFLGWAVTSASDVVAVSVQWIGETGEGPAVLPAGSVQPEEGIQLPVAPADVALTSIDVIERFVRDGAQFQRLGLKGTPPDPAGTFKGVHVYGEIPDGCDADQARVEDAVVGTSVVGIERQPLDFGKHPYAAADIYLAVFEVADVESDTPARFYAVSYSTVVENDLVYADEADPTPSVTITLTPNPVVISGEEYAPNASGFAQTSGYPFYELRNNVWTYQFGFEWIAPTSSPRWSALTGYQIVFEYTDGSRAPAGWIAPDHTAWISNQWPCPLSDTIIAWLCSQGADGQNTIIEGVTPKLTISIERPLDPTAGQEYAPLVTGQTASVTVEQTADGVEVYSFAFSWGTPASDELAGVHVWAHETERDTWHELAGVIPAEDNGEQHTDRWPLQQPCTFDIWFYSVSRDGRENTHSATVTPHVHLAQIKPNTDPTIIRSRIIPIAAPPAPASNSSTIQTATIGGVPSFRFHLVTTTGGGTTEGYLAQARYYSDAAATVPTSDWIPLGWIDPAATILDTAYWPRPAVQDYAKVRIAAQTADNLLGPWVESAVLTRPASTGLDGAQIAPESLVTAAFAATIRPWALLTSAPSLPDPLYPAGSPVRILSGGVTTLYRVNAAGDALEKLINGAEDIVAKSISTPQIAAGAISTAELAVTEILVGAGGGKCPKIVVVSGIGQMLAAIGDFTTWQGGYFINLRVGPDIDNPVISASAGGVTINGAPLTLNLNNVETKIANLSESWGIAGAQIKSTQAQYNYRKVVISDDGIRFLDAGGSYAGEWLFTRVPAAGLNYSVLSLRNNGAQTILLDGGTGAISAGGMLVGAGVNCVLGGTGYGIAGGGFNPFVGGVQYYGATGSIYATLLRTNSGDLEYWNGTTWVPVGSSGVSLFSVINTGVTALNFKGGAIV